MKKIILISLLLAITGCGEQDASETSLSDVNSISLNTISHEQGQMTKAKTSNSLSLGGWSLFNPVPIGAEVFYEGLKELLNSSALITPNASQVAKQLGKGVAGVALSVAVEQLLGAVDWVLDPANNQIRYTKTTMCTGTCVYSVESVSGTYNTGAAVCKAYELYLDSSAANIKYGYYAKVSYAVDNAYPSSPGYCIGYIYTSSGGVVQSVASRVNYNSNATLEEATISLETVAQEVIDNAAGNDANAQVATVAAAADIVTEAENDEALRQSLVDQLEDNAKCPNGIRSEYGQCWICSKESYPSIRWRVVYAKDIVGGLGKCNQMMNSSELLTRYNAYSELGTARDTENACWTPPHQNHIQQAIDAKNVAVECNNFLGLLGQ